MLVTMNKILSDALKNGYACPHFNINNLEWTKYILLEWEKEKSPVILGVSSGALDYMGGANTVVSVVKGLMSDLQITIPVCLHLDHGKTFDICKKVIDAGFSSVMIDASAHELDKNIDITIQVVSYAHNKNVSVEGEIGYIGSSNEDVRSVSIDDCLEFCRRTDIDAIAPALGSVHGLYKGRPNLDFDKMKRIKDLLNIPLVLHGGSGIPAHDIKTAIKCGISKINVNTDLQIAWSNEVREYLSNNKDIYDPRKIIGSGEVAIRKVVNEKIKLFGSFDRYTN